MRFKSSVSFVGNNVEAIVIENPRVPKVSARTRMTIKRSDAVRALTYDLARYTKMDGNDNEYLVKARQEIRDRFNQGFERNYSGN